MKKWNAPEIATLNLSETANGRFDYTEEGKLVVYSLCLPIPLGFTNDDLAEQTGGEGEGEEKGRGETTESES